MGDKKFIIALSVIIVLAIALVYLTVIGPKIQGYVVGKQAQAQENVVNAILNMVDQQGYVAIGDGENSVVLVKYNPDGVQQADTSDTSEEVIEVE
jgi:type II secretory pathway pseudopilin PulG